MTWRPRSARCGKTFAVACSLGRYNASHLQIQTGLRHVIDAVPTLLIEVGEIGSAETGIATCILRRIRPINLVGRSQPRYVHVAFRSGFESCTITHC